jgi:hypothetical protein
VHTASHRRRQVLSLAAAAGAFLAATVIPVATASAVGASITTPVDGPVVGDAPFPAIAGPGDGGAGGNGGAGGRGGHGGNGEAAGRVVMAVYPEPVAPAVRPVLAVSPANPVSLASPAGSRQGLPLE